MLNTLTEEINSSAFCRELSCCDGLLQLGLHSRVQDVHAGAIKCYHARAYSGSAACSAAVERSWNMCLYVEGAVVNSLEWAKGFECNGPIAYSKVGIPRLFSEYFTTRITFFCQCEFLRSPMLFSSYYQL